jgi:hypothetical protein
MGSGRNPEAFFWTFGIGTSGGSQFAFLKALKERGQHPIGVKVCDRSGPFHDRRWFGLTDSSHLTNEFYLFPFLCLFPFHDFVLYLDLFLGV